jgi:hypothetical protein
MKRRFSDGRDEIVLAPREFLLRLAAIVPPPRRPLVCYHGIFAPHARDRRALTRRRDSADAPHPAVPPPAPSVLDDEPAPPPLPDRPRRLDWAALLKRVHQVDVFVCDRCGGRRRVIAFIPDQAICARILDHLGIPKVVFPVPSARPPPGAAGFGGPAFDPCIDPPAAD